MRKMKKRPKEFIPSIFTVMNMFIGFMAMGFLMRGDPIRAGWLILFACFFVRHWVPEAPGVQRRTKTRRFVTFSARGAKLRPILQSLATRSASHHRVLAVSGQGEPGR